MTDNKQTYRFSDAPIWDINRQYYEQAGLNAWNNDQVPQYISSNPLMGKTYAELIFGFLQDRATKNDSLEPIFIVELGAGIGRLGFHVLHELCELIDYAGLELPPFKYIMTDLVMSNVIGWKESAILQTFINKGILDFAKFDAVQDSELNLVVSNTKIKKGDL